MNESEVNSLQPIKNVQAWDLDDGKHFQYCAPCSNLIKSWTQARSFYKGPDELTRQTHRRYLGSHTETTMGPLLPQASTFPRKPKVRSDLCLSMGHLLKIFSPRVVGENEDKCTSTIKKKKEKSPRKSTAHHLIKPVEKAGHRILNFIISY